MTLKKSGSATEGKAAAMSMDDTQIKKFLPMVRAIARRIGVCGTSV